MFAIVLAAGRGTRMGRLTAHTPKPLLAVQGRPILEHVLLGLRAAGIKEAAIVTGYLGEQIERHFEDGAKLGLTLCYFRQAHPEGTAKALLLARRATRERPAIVSWGDILIDPGQYRVLAQSFAAQPCDALLLLNEVDDPWRGAAVYVDPQWRVTRLIEKPERGASTTHWNNAGVFVLAPVAFEYAERVDPSPRGEYELPQAIGAMIADQRDVRAHPLHGFWSDLGTPEDLVQAERTYPGGAV